MAWYHNGKKYWYHNGKKYSKKMKYSTYKLERDRDTWLKFADESNSWFNSFYKKKKRDKVSEAIFNMASDPKFKDSINLEKARMDRKVREWENFTGESLKDDYEFEKWFNNNITMLENNGYTRDDFKYMNKKQIQKKVFNERKIVI